MNWLDLLQKQQAWWSSLAVSSSEKNIAGLVLFIVSASAVYGATLGLWHSATMAFYTAVKFPIVIFGSIGLAAGVNLLIAVLLGSGIGLRQAMLLALSAMGLMSWVLLGLLPIVCFFLFSAPNSAADQSALQYSHNVVLLLHIVTLGAAGFAGVYGLWTGIAALVPERRNRPPLFLGWLGSFSVVGCQLSWMLRPFIGSPFYPTAFLRDDALERNFFEFVLWEVLPFVAQRTGE